MKKRKILKKNRRVYNKKIKKINHKRHYKKRIKKVLSVAPITSTMIINPVITTLTPVVTDVISIPKKRRGRRSKGDATAPNKMYFTQDTENAIILYNQTTDENIRNEIYNTKIKYAFEKLVENIFNTFKFSYFETGPLDVQRECLSHLVGNMNKFEAGKGKAFSYFSIIAKHYLIALNNGVYKRRNQHVEIGEEYDENTIQLQTEDKYHKNAETSEFMQLMISFWENNVEKIFTKQRDLNIAQVVVELFRSSQSISMFNKKALYLYIREISDCRTQQITKIINRMKKYQLNISQSYINTGIVDVNNYSKV